MLKSFFNKKITASLIVFGITVCGVSRVATADFGKGLQAYDKGDYRAAYAEWIDDAENGDLAAQRNIGNLYRWGKGTEQNPSRAAYWYYRAAKAGFDRAQFNLAMLYFRGEGVPKDELEAIRWLDKAKSQGNKDAEKILSWLKVEENKSALSAVLNGLEDDTPSFVKEYEEAKSVAEEKTVSDTSEIPAALEEGVEKEKTMVVASNSSNLNLSTSVGPTPIKTVGQDPYAVKTIPVKSSSVKDVTETVKAKIAKKPKEKVISKSVKKKAIVKKSFKAKEFKVAAVKIPVKRESVIKSVSYFRKKGVLKAHLGSYSVESGAHKDWNSFHAKSKVLKKLDKMVVKVDLGIKGIWYRLYAIGDAHVIEGLCADFKSKKAYCLLTRKSL
ncbi:MAG: sel1 repeat family protein [Alphaproteobacteria bacterium]|nr:sel1 repeat family protein [Alphaproteobacteria bacterium]